MFQQDDMAVTIAYAMNSSAINISFSILQRE
jgi:hypothetical protein